MLLVMGFHVVAGVLGPLFGALSYFSPKNQPAAPYVFFTPFFGMAGAFGALGAAGLLCPVVLDGAGLAVFYLLGGFVGAGFGFLAAAWVRTSRDQPAPSPLFNATVTASIMASFVAAPALAAASQTGVWFEKLPAVAEVRAANASEVGPVSPLLLAALDMPTPECERKAMRDRRHWRAELAARIVGSLSPRDLHRRLGWMMDKVNLAAAVSFKYSPEESEGLYFRLVPVRPLGGSCAALFGRACSDLSLEQAAAAAEWIRAPERLAGGRVPFERIAAEAAELAGRCHRAYSRSAGMSVEPGGGDGLVPRVAFR